MLRYLYTYRRIFCYNICLWLWVALFKMEGMFKIEWSISYFVFLYFSGTFMLHMVCHDYVFTMVLMIFCSIFSDSYIDQVPRPQQRTNPVMK